MIINTFRNQFKFYKQSKESEKVLKWKIYPESGTHIISRHIAADTGIERARVDIVAIVDHSVDMISRHSSRHRY